MSDRKEIGIIGVGAAGLCALKHSLQETGMSVTAWEHSNTVGGTWAYSSTVGVDNHGYPIHSSMYTNMRTNLPKEIMRFPDLAFDNDTNSFVHHTKVHDYLRTYAQHFDLYPHIKFNHHVEHVEPVQQDQEPPKWKVTAKDIIAGVSSSTICDFLFVCNGHYSVPSTPCIEGIEQFKGTQLHSHNYREPSAYRHLNVALLGAGASGMDISLEIATVANKAYMCHNAPAPIPSELPANLLQRKGIVKAVHNGFILKDGMFIEADAIVYCTGYKFTFPFLSKECELKIDGNQVKPLYKHVLHTQYPSIGFPGLVFQVLPFPTFDVQVRYLLKAFLGEFQLPSKKEMDEDSEVDFEKRLAASMPPRHRHRMGNRQWDYTNDLIEEAQLTPTSKLVQKIFETVHHERRTNLTTYKSHRCVISGDEEFEMVPTGFE